MTQEDKDLLLKVLCERQMYNIKCKVFDDANPYTLSGVLHSKPYSQLYFEELDWKEFDGFVGVEYCKPYLFPMSSMTEEQSKYFGLLQAESIKSETLYPFHCANLMRFIYENHLDYMDLIGKGLAIDATNLNIY